jgi:four helix bundle protein
MDGQRDHTRLDLWRVSRGLVVKAYALAESLPAIERYALADQIRRSAVSVPANVAEGYGRGSARDFARSLRIARGSLAELHSHITLASDLGYVVEGVSEIFHEIERVRRMINAMIGALKRRHRDGD